MSIENHSKLEAQIAVALQAMGVPLRAMKAGLIRVGEGAKAQAWHVVQMRQLTPASLGAALMKARQADQPALLIAPYITPPMAKALREHEQPFADAAGNAWIPGKGMLVHITGQKPAAKLVEPASGKADTPAGLKILFALLCQPDLTNTTLREIAAAAGVALGSVPPVLQDLQAQGHVLALGKQRRLHATRGLLDAWAQAYARRLRHKTLQAVYATPDFEHWRAWPLVGAAARAPACWGGESAAALLTDYLRPGILTLYAEAMPPQWLARLRMRKPALGQTEQLLEWRHPFWGKMAIGGRKDVAPPVLVYADLLATGDGRCIDTANMLYEQYLLETFP
jgi:hypothetical protein